MRLKPIRLVNGVVNVVKQQALSAGGKSAFAIQ